MKILKKFIILLSLVGVTLGSAWFFVNQPHIIKVYDLNNKVQKINIENKCVFVWSANCSACFQSLAQVNFLKQQLNGVNSDVIFVLADENVALRKMARAHFIRFNLVDLITFYDNGYKLQKKYDVSLWPTLLVFDKNAKLVKKIEGYVAWSQDPQLYEIIDLVKK